MRRQCWKGKSNCVATKLFLVYSATYLVTKMPLERRPLASKLPVGPFFLFLFFFFQMQIFVAAKTGVTFVAAKMPLLGSAALVVTQT